MMVEAVEALMLVHGSVLPKENRRTGQLPTGTVEIRKQNEQECFDVKPTEQKSWRKRWLCFWKKYTLALYCKSN